MNRSRQALYIPHSQLYAGGANSVDVDIMDKGDSFRSNGEQSGARPACGLNLNLEVQIVDMLVNCVQAVAVVIIMILCFVAGYEAGKNDATTHINRREYPIVMEHKHGE